MKIEQVLADAAEDVTTLEAYGHDKAAAAVGNIVARARAALAEFMTWHDEAGAMLMSGKPRGHFTSRFPEWERRGLAERRGRGRRVYRECVIPKPVDVAAAREAGEQDAREESA